jgi:hypothetical protein
MMNALMQGLVYKQKYQGKPHFTTKLETAYHDSWAGTNNAARLHEKRQSFNALQEPPEDPGRERISHDRTQPVEPVKHLGSLYFSTFVNNRWLPDHPDVLLAQAQTQKALCHDFVGHGAACPEPELPDLSRALAFKRRLYPA